VSESAVVALAYVLTYGLIAWYCWRLFFRLRNLRRQTPGPAESGTSGRINAD
jgi:hypothetical protein